MTIDMSHVRSVMLSGERNVTAVKLDGESIWQAAAPDIFSASWLYRTDIRNRTAGSVFETKPAGGYLLAAADGGLPVAVGSGKTVVWSGAGFPPEEFPDSAISLRVIFCKLEDGAYTCVSESTSYSLAGDDVTVTVSPDEQYTHFVLRFSAQKSQNSTFSADEQAEIVADRIEIRQG